VAKEVSDFWTIPKPEGEDISGSFPAEDLHVALNHVHSKAKSQD